MTSTRETEAKRLALVNGSGDQALAASVPGILFANAPLSQTQYVACQHYARWHRLVFGNIWDSATRIAEKAEGVFFNGPPADSSIEMAQRRLAKAHEKLSEEQRQAVANVAVYQFLPHWFYVSRLRLRTLPEDVAARDALLSGLDVIIKLTGSADNATRE